MTGNALSGELGGHCRTGSTTETTLCNIHLTYLKNNTIKPVLSIFQNK